MTLNMEPEDALKRFVGLSDRKKAVKILEVFDQLEAATVMEHAADQRLISIDQVRKVLLGPNYHLDEASCETWIDGGCECQDAQVFADNLKVDLY